jgi:hypothetical protein
MRLRTKLMALGTGMMLLAGLAGTVTGAASAAAGTGWAIQPTPNPTTAGSTLVSVSCRSAACTAVGYYKTKSAKYGNIPRPLAEKWNGTRWVIQPGAQPGAQGSELTGVSCSSASRCSAVGWYTAKSGITRTLAEYWNGTAWATQATPNLAPDISTQFTGVSCSSASACTAVGWYIANSDGNTGSLVERWNGTSWSIQSNPAGGATNGILAGVSCTSGTACTAVGSYDINGNPILAERWNGTRWTMLPTPPAPAGASSAAVNGVSCSSASLCTATGDYFPAGSFTPLSLAERWNGSQWAVQPTPNPANGAILEAVSCPSATACTAAGVSGPAAVAEAWNGATWAIESTPSPTKAHGTGLTGVSCVAPATCTAVGDWNYQSAGPTGQTLAEHKQGS